MNNLSPIASRCDIYGGYMTFGKIVFGTISIGALVDYSGTIVSGFPSPATDSIYDDAPERNSLLVIFNHQNYESISLGYIYVDGRLRLDINYGNWYFVSFSYIMK